MNLKISALEFVQEVQTGNISAEDFVAKTLERIQSIDDKLHAFLSVNEKAVDQGLSGQDAYNYADAGMGMSQSLAAPKDLAKVQYANGAVAFPGVGGGDQQAHRGV